jgi:small subunit ribosomal protein S20
MANTKNAEKRHRQSLVRRARNRSRITRLRNQIKKLRAAVENGDAETARQLLPETISSIDRTARIGAVHQNAAARSKSRLLRAVRSLDSAAQPS